MIFGESVLGKLAMTFFHGYGSGGGAAGAIPLGVAAGLPPAVAAVTAMAGNLTPVPCILLLLRRVFALMRKSPWLGPKVDRLERRAHLKGRKVRKYRTLGLVLLVAIPPAGDRGVDRGAGGGRAGYSHADRSASHRRGRCHRRVYHHGCDLRRGGTDVRGGTKSESSGLITIKNGS